MITRRSFLKSAMVGTVFAALPKPRIALTKPNAARAAAPNVLMIIADDMNDYGFYGTLGGVKMPYLQKFKRTAMTFDKAYCASPACVPSRAA